MSKLTHEAAIDKLKLAAGDMVEALYGCDPDDPVSSVLHWAKDLRDALSTVAILDGSAEGIQDDEDEDADPDLPPECDLCEGQGFGADGEGAVACPQCGGTGVQPEEWERI